MLSRRNLLLGALAASTAPAIVRAESLMKLYVPPLLLYADMLHDDTAALQAWVDGDRRVIWADSRADVGLVIDGHRFKVASNGTPLYVRGNDGPLKVLTNCIFDTCAPRHRLPNFEAPLLDFSTYRVTPLTFS